MNNYMQLKNNNNKKQPNQKIGSRHKFSVLQRRYMLASRHMKKSSTSLIIREVQIKTTMRYHFTLVRMAINNKSTNKFWGWYGGKGMFLHWWLECKLVQPPWKTIWRYLRKLNLELLYDPVIPLLGLYLDKSTIQKDTCALIYVYNSTIHSSQDMGTT